MSTPTKKCYQCAMNIPWDAIVCPHCGARYNADQIKYRKLSVKRAGCLGIFFIFLGMYLAAKYSQSSDPKAALISFILSGGFGIFLIIGAVYNFKKRKALKRKMRNQ